VEKKIMRQRSIFSFFVASAIVLLLTGIAGCSALFSQSQVNLTGGGEIARQPSAAMFVSKRAPVMVSILENPAELPALQRDKELSQLKTTILANTKIDYQEDIQPWLGNEITLAVTTLDIDRDPDNGLQPGYLMALSTNKPDKSREFLELLFSKRALAGATLAVEQYKGVKLIYDHQIRSTSGDKRELKKQDSLAGAAFGDSFLLFANAPKVLREAINNVQVTDLNLTSSSKYQQASKQVSKEALAVAFLNLPMVVDWIGLELPELTYDSEIISVLLKPQGLLTETAFVSTKETLPTLEQLSNPVGALKYIPASAGLAVSGKNLSSLGNSDLAQLWQQLTPVISSPGENLASRLVQPIANRENTWGINLSKDIFTWVKGEYAIGLLPRPEQINPDWIFVAEKSEATPAGISHLDEIAASDGLSVNSLSFDSQKVSAWTRLTTTATQSSEGEKPSFTVQANVLGAHTTVGNYEIFTSSLEVMNEALTDEKNALLNNSNFQNSIAAIPKPNQGYVYLDWTKTQKFLERELPILQLLEVIGKPFFQNLQALTVSNYGSDTRLLKGGVFFQLGN
jgi:hypothetical protein